MALKLDYLRDRKERNMGHIIPGRRLWLTADGTQLVEDGHPEARSLFCGPSDEISEADAECFGIKAEPPLEDKAVKSPPEDKAARIMEPEVKRQRRRKAARR